MIIRFILSLLLILFTSYHVLAAPYLGDYVEDETVHFIWHTNDSDGASITRSVDGTVSVYKDNGTSQSTAGVTDTEDFDSLTGIHACTIDLSADAFYATGANYTVVLSAATIDSQTVNAVLAHFSIENRFKEVDVVSVAGDAVQDNGDGRLEVNVEEIADAAVSTSSAQLGVNVVNISGDSTAADNAELAFDGTGYGFTNCTMPTVTTLTGHTAQTGDNYARIGAPAGVSLSADIAAIKTDTGNIETDTQDLQTQIGTDGDGLTSLPWNAAWDAEVQSEATDALNAYDPPTKAELDSGLAGLNDISTADVNAQVSDVIKTDTISEMSQGAPPGSPTMEQAINYLYKAWRNKNMTDSTTIEVYDDAGTTVLFKSTISDDGTDFTKGEYATGP